MGFYEYGKQSYGYAKGEDFLSGCMSVRRIVFHEVCFCYSTIITFVAWRELLCLLFIGILTLSCPLCFYPFRVPCGKPVGILIFLCSLVSKPFHYHVLIYCRIMILS
jgi:hypothetical protein